LSDGLLATSSLVPFALSLTVPQPGDEGDSRLRGIRNQVESLVFTAGSNLLLKRLFSRPRPYTYLSEAERPPGRRYDVHRDDAFESFPSGHAAASWASAATAVSYLAMERPDISRGWHYAGGLAVGGLAMSTSLLRVDAVKHFPTDVLAGAALGLGMGLLASGIHPDSSPDPSGTRDARSSGWLGAASGALIGLLITPPTSPLWN
jgi:membrane-associated phospholipid phosphatase